MLAFVLAWSLNVENSVNLSGVRWGSEIILRMEQRREAEGRAVEILCLVPGFCSREVNKMLCVSCWSIHKLLWARRGGGDELQILCPVYVSCLFARGEQNCSVFRGGRGVLSFRRNCLVTFSRNVFSFCKGGSVCVLRGGSIL